MTQSKLVYYNDKEPGITRQRCGRGFSYYDVGGALVRDKTERHRINAIAVPPAYENVWICPLPQGHLLATGQDERGRKQYLYHPEWTEMQAQTKFDSLADFGQVLPRIRRRVREDLKATVGERRFALAATVRLVDKASVRVGNQTYTDENGTYGALTLRNKHILLKDNRISLSFKAKGGKRVRRQIADRTLARVLEKIGDLPGATLLSWINDADEVQTLNSQALNTYIAEAAGTQDVTAKTFRTWAGTVAAFEVAENGPATIKDMATASSKVLHNTPAIARRSYVHPDVIALAGKEMTKVEAKPRADLRLVEQRLIAFLENN